MWKRKESDARDLSILPKEPISPSENPGSLRPRIVDALFNLGYKPIHAEWAFAMAVKSSLGPSSFDSLFRASLDRIVYGEPLPNYVVQPYGSEEQEAIADFASFAECLKSDQADIATKFYYAVKEVAAPVSSIIERSNREIPVLLVFFLEITRIIAQLANACGGVTGADAELLLHIASKLRRIDLPEQVKFEQLTVDLPSQARKLLVAEVGTGFDFEIVTTTLKSLRQYDIERGTAEARKLAALYLDLVSEVTTAHADSTQKVMATALYTAAIGRYLPNKPVESAEQDVSADYELLEAQPGCTKAELKSAYRRKASQWHPDYLERMAPELRQFATEKLARINAAYEKLSRLNPGDAQE